MVMAMVVVMVMVMVMVIMVATCFHLKRQEFDDRSKHKLVRHGH